jgi:hypothetical protein
MKFKVVKSDSLRIELETGTGANKKNLTIGRQKHPSFFGMKGRYHVPLLEIGHEEDIPNEALATSEGGRYFLPHELSLGQQASMVALKAAKIDLEVKTLQLKAFQ